VRDALALYDDRNDQTRPGLEVKGCRTKRSDNLVSGRGIGRFDQRDAQTPQC
jgi:hypothetical protein